MAYDKTQIFEQAKQAAIDNALVFIEEVVSYLPLTKPTFYVYFPIDSNEFNEIKAIIENNKVTIKAEQRKKWRDSSNPVLQMGLYKLLSTPEELKQLSMQHVDHTTQGKEINKIELTVLKDGTET
jgi:hypothetical protein